MLECADDGEELVIPDWVVLFYLSEGGGVITHSVRTVAWSLQFYVLFETDNFCYYSLAPSHVPLHHMTPPDPL